MFEETAFNRRLTVLHETLAPLGEATAEKPVISAIWHETVAGRSGCEVTAVVLRLLSAPQLPSDEYEHLVIWLDNCAGQNKKYILFSALYNAIRTGIIPLSSLTLMFFVPGHSFMSADAFHAAVERNIMKNPVLLNIREFDYSQSNCNQSHSNDN